MQAVCYEFAVEMTYPLPEGVSAGLINFMSQVLVYTVMLVTTIIIKILIPYSWKYNYTLLVRIKIWQLSPKLPLEKNLIFVDLYLAVGYRIAISLHP